MNGDLHRARIRRRGWMLWDLAAVLAVLAIVAALLVVCFSRSRAMGQLSGSLTNLRELGSAIHAYGLDNADRVASFSWRKGDTSSQFPDLRNPTDDVQAGAFQAADIIRRRAPLTPAEFPRVTGWIAHVRYSHLALLDYLDQQAPWTRAVSPAHGQQLTWAADPKNWQTLGAPNYRHPFTSSYEMPPAWWSSPESGSDAISQQASHALFDVISTVQTGTRRLGECVYPGNKALMYAWAGRYTGPREVFFMHHEARVPVLAADGAAALRNTASINAGWYPRSPGGNDVVFVPYLPQSWEPPLPETNTFVVGRMRFTRYGLGGRDFDGAEIRPR